MKEIFSVNSQHANGKRKYSCKKKNSMSWAELKEAGTELRRVRGVVNYCPSIGSQNRAQVYRCRSPRIKGQPLSLYNRSHICLPIYIYGFSKGAGPLLKTKEKKLDENVFMTYFEDRREQRETTYIYRTEPWNDSMYEDQYSVPLPPIQVLMNKAITYSYTI